MIKDRINDYLTYATNAISVQNYVLDNEDGIEEKVNLLNENDLTTSYKIVQEQLDQSVNFLDLFQSLQLKIILNDVSQRFQDNQASYLEFLVEQFEKSFQEEDKHLFRMELLLRIYYSLPYSERIDLIFNAIDFVVEKRSAFNQYRFMIILEDLVDILDTQLSSKKTQIQGYVRKISYQFPDQEEFSEGVTNYLIKALLLLNSDMEENKRVFNHWKDSEYQSIAEMAKRRLDA